MTYDYDKMLSTINMIINELRNHDCNSEHCCIRSLLEEIEFND